MMKGIIKSYDPAKGYGFIRDVEDNSSYFFHITNCEIPEQQIKRGTVVTFELLDTIRPNGQKAIKAVGVELFNTGRN